VPPSAEPVRREPAKAQEVNAEATAPSAPQPAPEPAAKAPAKSAATVEVKPTDRPAPKPEDSTPDPFSVESIEAEFARLLGRTEPGKDK